MKKKTGCPVSCAMLCQLCTGSGIQLLLLAAWTQRAKATATLIIWWAQALKALPSTPVEDDLNGFPPTAGRRADNEVLQRECAASLSLKKGNEQVESPGGATLSKPL